MPRAIGLGLSSIFSQVSPAGFIFSLSDATFTPAMAKRNAPGPFTSAPIIQGNFDGSGTPDNLNFLRGNQVVNNFYDAFDPYQGTIVLWWTPEKDRDASSSDSEIFYLGSNYRWRYRHDAEQFTIKIGGQTLIVSHTAVAGVTTLLVLRWNTTNTLDGTNYACLSINDSHNFGITTQPSSLTFNATETIGSAGGAGFPANALIEGLTVYRRVLYDGTYGIAADGSTDELAAIYASGSGKQPEEVCSEDIVFAFPTNGTTGELSSGTGEAWNFSWVDNKLTNWHLQNATSGAPDSWTAVNAPTLADAATADILFGTRAQKISVDAINEGIKQAYAVSAGEDYWLGAWVKTGGANQGVDIRVYDATGAADVAVLTTDSSSYVYLSTCFEVPAGCSSIEIYIESTDADTYDIHAQQVMVLPNLVNNGGMEGTYDDESGGGGGTVNVAPGWNALNVETDGTDTLDESATAHTGSKSQLINVDATLEGIRTSSNTFTTGKWYIVTLWLYGTSGSARMWSGTHLSLDVTPSVGAWTRHSAVFIATSNNTLSITSVGGAASFLVDDISIIELDDISITVTPADETNCSENGGLRVVGRSTLNQAIPDGDIGLTSGSIKFYWRPRHAAGDALKFLESTSVYIAAATNLTIPLDYHIYMYWSTNSIIRVEFEDGGSTTGANWDATGLIDADTEYLVEWKYDETGLYVYIDGILRHSAVDPLDFGSYPLNMFYAGSRIYIGDRQCGAVYR